MFIITCPDCGLIIMAADSLDASQEANDRGWKVWEDGWVCPECTEVREGPEEPYYDDRRHQMKRD